MKKSNWKIPLILFAGVISVVLFIVFMVQGVQDKAFILEEQVKVAKSDIEVQEKSRVDKVMNLADCVKQYDKHEADTLIAIAEGRSVSGNIENASAVVLAATENYPELQSDENYKNLMNELIIIENLIAEYRSNYNEQVKIYNRYVRKFKNRLFLDFLGYEKQDYEYLEFNAPETAPQNLFGE